MKATLKIGLELLADLQVSYVFLPCTLKKKRKENIYMWGRFQITAKCGQPNLILRNRIFFQDSYDFFEPKKKIEKLERLFVFAP